MTNGPRRLKPITCYFEPAQLKALQRLSRLTRVPQAVYIREALDRLLKGDGAVARYGAMTMEVLGHKLGKPKFVKAERKAGR